MHLCVCSKQSAANVRVREYVCVCVCTCGDGARSTAALPSQATQEIQERPLSDLMGFLVFTKVYYMTLNILDNQLFSCASFGGP